MKPLVIYHANCADGFGAAFAAWLKLGDEAEYLPVQYGEKTPLDPSKIQYEGREVYVLDFSFPREAMDRLFANAKRAVWLDHHKTAFEMWGITNGQRVYVEGDKHYHDGSDSYVKLHLDKSGAYLAWEYFHPGEEVPMLIKHIDDYDRWVFTLRGTKEINKVVWSYAPWNFEQWVDLMRDDYGQLFSEGLAILRAHDQNVQSVVKGSARWCSISTCSPQHGPDIADTVTPSWSDGYLRKLDGFSVNCPPHLTSDVGHELATQSGTFGLCWTLGETGLIANCSLRSNGEYDVSVIAKAFGGGGHRNASGMEVPIETLLSWLK